MRYPRRAGLDYGAPAPMVAPLAAAIPPAAAAPPYWVM